jgi:hypothetical protein
MSNIPLLLPSYYLPSIEYLRLCKKSDSILIEQCENHKKGNYTNRAHIASAGGILRLSIPLEKGKNQKQPIKDVRISYSEPWQHIHWQSLCSSYNHSPYFEFYKDGLEVFYKKKINFLIDWNTELLRWLFSVFKLTVDIQFTSEYHNVYHTGIADARNDFNPKNTISDSLIYPQVFESKNGFLPNLSSIDLLFNAGVDKLS